MKIFKVLTMIIVSLSLASCGGKENTNSTGTSDNQSSKDKQLNITFLLDLSDRIEPSKYPNTPEHWQRDMAIVNDFVEIFKNEIHNKGNLGMKGKMRVLFSPAPKDESINEIAKALDVNTADMKPAEKKKYIKLLWKIIKMD